MKVRSSSSPHPVGRMVQSYLGSVQQAEDSMDVGVGSYHDGVGGDTRQVAMLVLSHLHPGALRTEQLELGGLEVHCPRLPRVTCHMQITRFVQEKYWGAWT